MLSTNEKLGTSILGFSLPNVTTCPGATEICKRVCYVNRYTKRFAGIDYRPQLRSTKRPTFFRNMVALVRSSDKETIRIHVSGDFYSAPYIRAWIKIIKAFPQKRFFGYTRSWRV